MPLEFQDRPKHLATICIVLDHKNAKGARYDAGCRSRFRAHLTGLAERQPDDKLAPPSRALAGDRDAPPVQLDEVPHNRETDAQPALGARYRSLTLCEKIEHARKQVGRNPDTVVSDAQHRVGVLPAGAHSDMPLR
jgi:hypothetical protein